LGLEIILLPTFGKIFRLSNVNDAQKIVNIFLFNFGNVTVHKSSLSDLQLFLSSHSIKSIVSGKNESNTFTK